MHVKSLQNLSRLQELYAQNTVNSVQYLTGFKNYGFEKNNLLSDFYRPDRERNQVTGHKKSPSPATHSLRSNIIMNVSLIKNKEDSNSYYSTAFDFNVKISTEAAYAANTDTSYIYEPQLNFKIDTDSDKSHFITSTDKHSGFFIGPDENWLFTRPFLNSISTPEPIPAPALSHIAVPVSTSVPAPAPITAIASDPLFTPKSALASPQAVSLSDTPTAPLSVQNSANTVTIDQPGVIEVDLREDLSVQYRGNTSSGVNLRGIMSILISGTTSCPVLLSTPLVDNCNTFTENKRVCQMQTDSVRRVLRVNLDEVSKYQQNQQTSVGALMSVPLLRYQEAENFVPAALIRARCMLSAEAGRMKVSVYVQLHPSLVLTEASKGTAKTRSLCQLSVRVLLNALEQETNAVSVARFRPGQVGLLSGDKGTAVRALVWSDVVVPEASSAVTNEAAGTVRLDAILEMSSKDFKLPEPATLPIAVDASLQGRLISAHQVQVQLPPVIAAGKTITIKPVMLQTKLHYRFA
jgi:hypothetical protein